MITAMVDATRLPKWYIIDGEASLNDGRGNAVATRSAPIQWPNRGLRECGAGKDTWRA